MTFRTGLIFLGASVMLLTACGHKDIESAASAPPTNGNAFEDALYSAYLNLARIEHEESDPWDDTEFAERAAATAAGNPPAPEHIEDRKLPDDAIGELTEARTRLMASFVKGAKTNAPVRAAAAQVSFDCWMQEKEENFQPDDIARCRNGFMEAMDEVEVALDRSVNLASNAKPESTEPRPTRPETSTVPPQKSFTVYFEFDSATPTEEELKVLRDAAQAAKENGVTEVEIQGHADRAGPDSYNLDLSKRRSKAVAEALADLGIATSKLKTEGYGEQQPMVPTPDGKPEPHNRRVEISYLVR